MHLTLHRAGDAIPFRLTVFDQFIIIISILFFILTFSPYSSGMFMHSVELFRHNNISLPFYSTIVTNKNLES